MLQTYSYSVDIAKVYGVATAIYLNYALSQGAEQKITINREEMRTVTGLGISSQEKIEQALAAHGLIATKAQRNGDKVHIHLNIGKIENILDGSSLERLQRADEYSATVAKAKDKKSSIVNSLCKHITIENKELERLLHRWVETVIATGKPLSVPQVEQAQARIEREAPDFAKAVLEKAISVGWKDMDACIEECRKRKNADAHSFTVEKSDGTGVVDEEF